MKDYYQVVPLVEDLNCPHCGHKHYDIDDWALKPHKTHLCLNCGSLFEGTVKAVSNPVFTPNKLNDLIAGKLLHYRNNL